MKKELLRNAWLAAEKAYSPYSKYQVGAAVLGEDNKIYHGCNIENASYGLTVCAERNAIFNMVVNGCSKFIALAVVCKQSNDTHPCGACRQVMLEFCQNKDTPVYMQGLIESLDDTVGGLLPHSFFDFTK